jgi:hypothetical protein
MPAPKTRTDEAMMMKPLVQRSGKRTGMTLQALLGLSIKTMTTSSSSKLAHPFTTRCTADGGPLWGRVIRERKILAKSYGLSGRQPCKKNALRAWLQ